MLRARWLLLFSIVTLLPGCAAVVVAGAATGAAVAHDRRTFGSIVDDQTIEMKAGSAIVGNSDLRGQTHVNITSVNGIVLLTGEATTLEARDQVLQTVREVNGVRRITNELRIAEPSPVGNRSKDALITSAVKSRFLVARHLDPTRFKVVTENNAVYLMGIVTRDEGDLAAEQAATIDGVERVVKIFEYLD
ncbi:MAG TPA: BON domain-containing protein [Gammaproteobacteria bacterium]|nr:BON domain-containing protein [Gammaproteobacteria bacterium]